MKSPNRPQIEALRVGKTGQKQYFLAILDPQNTVETPSQLLFIQSRKGNSAKFGVEEGNQLFSLEH
jgi:hypothetical protein